MQDLSKVKYGLVRYENYVTFDNGNKYLTWEMDVLPEWDLIKEDGENPLITKLGLKKGEYIGVEMNTAEKNMDLEKYCDRMIEYYERNFNPDCFDFIGKSAVKLSGMDVCKLVFRVKTGSKKYIVDENLVVSDKLLYDIILKIPEDKYNTHKETYYKILDTFKVTDKETASLVKDIDNYNFQQQRNRVGKGNELTDFQNRLYKWSIKIPGNWNKDKSYDGDYVSFSEKNFGLCASVEALENNSQNRLIQPEEKFKYMDSLINKKGMILRNKESFSDKGAQVTAYNYRWENEEDEIYADVKFYILNSEKYSYCVFVVIPDEFKSQANIELMQDIWKSFNIQE